MLRKVLMITALMPLSTMANINMSEVSAQAYEGLAEICMSSRMITEPSQVQVIKSLYLEKKHARQAQFPADPGFSHYASRQLWGIGLGDNPDFEKCIALLK